MAKAEQGEVRLLGILETSFARSCRAYRPVGLALMPTVLRDGPYRFFFYSNEGREPPHVHVEEENKVAKFWLEPVSFARNSGFADQRLNQIQSLVQQHQAELLRRWHDHFSGR